MAMLTLYYLLLYFANVRGVMVFPNVRRTWPDAEQYCIDNYLNGHLASIDSVAEDNEFLNVMNGVSGNHWIGINDIAVEGDYGWSDGSVINYANWCGNEPDESSGVQDCVSYLNGNCWATGGCIDKQQFFACEFDTFAPTPAPQPVQRNCSPFVQCISMGDPHFTTFDGKRHHFQGANTYRYVRACNNNGQDRSLATGLPFMVHAQHYRCAGGTSCVSYAIVTLFDSTEQVKYQIVLERNGNARFLNGPLAGRSAFGHRILDATQGWTFTVVRSGGGVLLTAIFKDPTDGTTSYMRAVLTAASIATLRIDLSQCFKNLACGLCGYYDGNPGNDLHVPRGTSSRIRRLLQSTDEFIFENEYEIFEISETNNIWPITQNDWSIQGSFGDLWCDIDEGDDNLCEQTSTDLPITDECYNAASIQCDQIWESDCIEQCNDQPNQSLTKEDFMFDCAFDICAISGNIIQDSTFDENKNNGIFDSSVETCTLVCNIEDPSLTSALTWVEPCDNEPCQCDSEETGFEDPHCLICHDSGCSQCEGSNGEYFKLNDNYPCVDCKAVFGDECHHCQNYIGCNQCKDGFARRYHSFDNLYYCVNCIEEFGEGCLQCNDDEDGGCNNCESGYNRDYNSYNNRYECVLQSITNNDDNCEIDLSGCNNLYCIDENPFCLTWTEWGACETCDSNYWFKSRNHKCVSCDILEGCTKCSNWAGCQSCDTTNGYTKYWDVDCEIGRCLK